MKDFEPGDPRANNLGYWSHIAAMIDLTGSAERQVTYHELEDRLDFSSLQALSFGSAPVTRELMEQIHTAFGVVVGESYGLTEGRTDDMFKSSGESIYPKEVENLLLSNKAVVDACVAPIRHSFKGHVPAAMVMLMHSDAADEDTLKRHCLENGPAYAHPRRIVIVDQIPLNGAGKNDRALVTHDLDARFGAPTER